MKRKPGRGRKGVSKESEEEDQTISQNDINKKQNGDAPVEKKRKGKNASAVDDVSDDGSEVAEKDSVDGKSKRKRKSGSNADESSTNDSDGSDEPEYEVQQIVSEKNIRGSRHFLIRWKGYGPESDSWEAESTLNCQAALEEYEKSKKKHSSKGNKEPHRKNKPSDPLGDSDETEDSEEKSSTGGKSKKQRKSENYESNKNSSTNESDGDLDEPEYEVERIMNDKVIRGERHFLIRWKGYGPSSDTWEAESTLNCPSALDEYKKAKKKFPLKKNKKMVGKSTSEPEEKWDENEDFEVSRILDVHFKRDGGKEFLVAWKGYSQTYNSWEPQENMDCKEMIQKFLEKCDQAREATQKELRVNRKVTDRFTLSTNDSGRRLSKRNQGKQRVHYDDLE